jgi:S-DNA-T family DNA segregation ATPase FtsK/SpoIIIE
VARTIHWSNYGDIPTLEYPKSTTDTHHTDIAAFVDYIVDVARLGDYPAPRRPWLDALPERIDLGTLLPSAVSATRQDTLASSRRSLGVPIGIADLPSAQAQEIFIFDLAEGGNWALAGGPRSGKTSVLLTIATALAVNLDTRDVNIYCLDFGGGGLLALSELPHVGAVIRSSESERLEAWVVKLVGEHRRRQNLLSESNVANILEFREKAAGENALPFILVLIDRWEMIVQEFVPESGSSVLLELSRLIREGSNTGISFVVTGDRGLLTDRVFSHFAVRAALKLADKNDYRLIDLLPKDIGDAIPPGRLIRARDGVEVQIALWPRNEGDSMRDSLHVLSQTFKATSTTAQLRVDALPDRITTKLAATLPVSPLSDPDARFAVAVCGDTLSRLCMDPRRTIPGFAIAGPRASGRTTTAIQLTREAADFGWRIHILAEASLSLYRSVFGGSVDYISHESVATPGDLLGTFETGNHVIVIDDSERFFRSPLDIALAEVLARTTNLRVVITGSIEDFVNDLRGVGSLCKRSQTGLILRPASVLDGQVFGQRIERTMLGGPPGRGQFFIRGAQVRAQIVGLDSANPKE